MSSNGYELGTAQTFDRATPKIQTISEPIPDGSIRSVVSYNAEGELLLVMGDSGETKLYRSINGGGKWLGPFFTTTASWGNDWFETEDGSLLFTLSDEGVYRYTGGGESPTKTLDGFNTFHQGYAQTFDGDIYVGEYGNQSDDSDIYKSTDDGQTWSFVVNVTNSINSNVRHVHGLAGVGNRLFVITGDADHSLVETDDDFSTHNEYFWNQLGEDDCAYTGITAVNNRLILGADARPPHITNLFVGDSLGLATDADLDNGDRPTDLYSILCPPITAPGGSASTTDQWHNVRGFIHRLESDGLMIYGMQRGGEVLCVSTNSGRTFKFVDLPTTGAGYPTIGEDNVFVPANGMILRIPKLSLWEYPEEDTLSYSLLVGDQVGDSSSNFNSVPLRSPPYELFDTITFGITVDAETSIRVSEDQEYGGAPYQSTSQVTGESITNNVISEDVTAGYNKFTHTDENFGLGVLVFDRDNTTASTVTLFARMSR